MSRCLTSGHAKMPPASHQVSAASLKLLIQQIHPHVRVERDSGMCVARDLYELANLPSSRVPLSDAPCIEASASLKVPPSEAPCGRHPPASKRRSERRRSAWRRAARLRPAAGCRSAGRLRREGPCDRHKRTTKKSYPGASSQRTIINADGSFSAANPNSNCLN